MKKDAFFRTNLVKNKIFKPNFLNESCLGEDLAKWLVNKFGESEFSFSAPHERGQGWEIDVKKDEERFFIFIGIMEETIGDENLEWLLVIEKPKSWFSFGQQNPSNFEKLYQEIAAVLQNESQISEITWDE
jgi:hypothetical protein